MYNVKAFVHKFRKSNEDLKEDDEFFHERKQLNSMHNYFTHSLLYLERLESVVKNINIMISDLNRSLMAFFESDVKLEIIQHISYILNTFSDVREQIITHISNSKYTVNVTLEKIRSLQKLCIKKKNINISIEHYEKKIKKLQTITSSNQKHLDKIIRNESKLNMVKSDYLKYHDQLKRGLTIVLENKIHKVLFDARKDLELLLCYFSLMNSVSFKLKDPLKEMKTKCQDVRINKMHIDYNFFLEEEDKMNIFCENKRDQYTNKNNGTTTSNNSMISDYNNNYKSKNHKHGDNKDPKNYSSNYIINDDNKPSKVIPTNSTTHKSNTNKQTDNYSKNPFNDNIETHKNDGGENSMAYDAFISNLDKKVRTATSKIKKITENIKNSTEQIKEAPKITYPPAFPQ
ncbi:conserved protein, unknown function [Hepatocystis sp. ex Piliocolobus tephrosceles]|nr:conserved protein, unknown function [Hepatocystis sp. ex Piliocolobus tephrosceles]